MAALRTTTLRVPPWGLAAALALLWLVLAPRTPDLAAQVYRAGLYAREGFEVWDPSWFAGHHMPGYSLLFPPLAALIGPRVVGALCAVASTWLFSRLAREHFGSRARPGVAWFAVASIADLCIGRLTFSMGVAVGLASLLAWQRGRLVVAMLLALTCAAASPVSAAFLALAGVAVALSRSNRRDPLARQGLGLAVAAMGGALVMSAASPEGGRQPFGTLAVLAVLGACAVLALALPREQRALRVGVGLYAAAAAAAFVLPTPMGSNATRLGATFAGPLLVCAASARGRRGAARAGLVAGALALGAWQWYAPAREVAKGVGDPSTGVAYYAGLTGFLADQDGPSGRVEVPFTRGHWESVHLARRFLLARGWETQLDTKLDGLFFERRLRPDAYHRWLRSNAVRWVAVPDAPLDPAGRHEAALVLRGVPYLRPAYSDAHWRVFAVRDPLPLVSGPARLVRMGRGGFVVRVLRPGHVAVRVHPTRYFALTGAAACLSATPGGWTRIDARAAGVVRVRARFTAGRALRSATVRCTPGTTPPPA